MATQRHAKGFTLVELLVVIVIIGILIALIFPAITSALNSTRITHCSHNLKQLWTAQNTYLSQFGGMDRLYPQDVGGNFWLRLAGTMPPVLDQSVAFGEGSIFHCPRKGGTFYPGTVDFRGPAWDINSVEQPFGDGDPIGADIDGNHGVDRGGNVLRKSSDIQNVKATDELWGVAASKTMP